MKKIPCGGFYLDDTLKVDENNMLGLAPGAGGVQSDWDINDPTKPEYIKNRICYDNYEEVEGSIYDRGSSYEPFPDALIINNEMWQLLLTKNATVLREDNGETYFFSEENNNNIIIYINVNDNPLKVSSLKVSKKEPKAYFESGGPDEVLGTLHNVVVSIGGIKQIDSKYIPSEFFKVTITSEDAGELVSDKTFAEIQDAYQAGKYIYAVAAAAGVVILPLFAFSSQKAMFISMIMDGEDNICFSLSITSKNEIILVENPLPPALESADDGKFLVADSGMYTLTSDVIIPSSTAGSSKKFKITVNDSGTITATEVTAT